MTLVFVRRICTLLILVVISGVFQAAVQIDKIGLPTQEQIETEVHNAKSRALYRYAVVIAASVGTYAVIQAAHEAASCLKLAANHDLEIKEIKAQLKVDGNNIAVQPDISWFGWINGKAKSLAGDMFSYAPQIASSMIFSGVFNYCKDRWQDLFADEHLIWYIDQQTKIWQLFADLKNYTIEYDIYSELLYAEALNQDAKLHMKAFTDDLIKAVKDCESDQLGNEGWSEVIFSGLKKKYAKQGIEMEKLQDAMMPYLAQRKRAQLEGFDKQRLFSVDAAKRQDIAQLCSLLVQQIQKSMAFMATHIQVSSPKIQHMIDVANEYVDQMQQLIAMNSNELEAMSSSQKGMFTVTYEFEKLFKDQVTYMYRYAKLMQ